MESKRQLSEMLAKMGHDKNSYLSNLFKYMPEAIAKELIYVEAKKDENLLVAGTPCESVYILLKGEVIGIDHQKMGHIYSFMDFMKVYIIGDFEVFAGYPEYSVSIKVAQDCKLLKIPVNSYLRWIQHDENALFLRLNNILTTLTFERKMEREYLFMSCKERLVSFLLKLYEKECKNFKPFKVEMTQTDLADKIGFNVRSVQRGVVALEKENWISNESGKIVISHEQYLKLKQY